MNKNVFITGTAQGIGRAIAIRFAQAGARVTGMDVDSKLNAETAGLAGDRFVALEGDVSSAADVTACVTLCGPVDILVNNAATVAGDGLLHEVTEEAWDRVSSVCLKSIFLCTKAVLPGMMERRSGVILSLGSINALTGLHLAAYTAAKGGVLSLTRLLAQQYGGVQVVGIDYWGKDWEYSKKVCEKNAQAANVENRVHFQKGDAAALDFANDTFDGAISHLTFHEVKSVADKKLVLQAAL